MQNPSFVPPFLPRHFVSGCRRRSLCCTYQQPRFIVSCASRTPDNASPVANRRNAALPLLATGFAALSVLFGAVPASAQQVGMQQRSVEHARTLSSTSPPRWFSRSSKATPTVFINPKVPSDPPQAPPTTSPCLIVPEDNLPEPQGTLLILEPSPYLTDDHRSSGWTVQTPIPMPAPSRNHSASSRTANAVPDWRAPRVHRPIYSPDRLLRLRPRVRPATLGLVGVGAFTSGSVFLRSLTQKGRSAGATGTLESPKELCSVVCMHIPFCVPDRERLLEGLARLADTACLVTPEGMAAAARDAAALLSKEGGLLEDSTKFAPDMDVCLADDIMAAERRFSGHVEIESHRIERLTGKNVGYDVSPHAKLGQYGVVTLVIATTVGVDLDCYDERTTVIRRLRAALDAVCRLQNGNVAGMELRWIPEHSEARSLTRAQLADAFPSLRVT